jgi:hypothetical protein
MPTTGDAGRCAVVPTEIVIAPVDESCIGTIPVVEGRVSVVVPATAGACKVQLPLVSPATEIELMLIILLIHLV